MVAQDRFSLLTEAQSFIVLILFSLGPIFIVKNKLRTDEELKSTEEQSLLLTSPNLGGIKR